MNQPPKVAFGFLDESGTLIGPERYFVVAAVIVEAPHHDRWRIPFKRAREHLGKERQGGAEFKFNNTSEATRRKILEAMAAETRAEFRVLRVDKQRRPVKSTPEHVGLVFGQVAVDCWQVYEALTLTLDRCFTNPRQDEALLGKVLQVVRAAGAGPLAVTTAASERHLLLQWADFVAGAFQHTYNTGENTFSAILTPRVVGETSMTWRELKAAWPRSK